MENCCNLQESYGQICVLCNACGRFNQATAKQCYLEVLKQRLEEKEDFDNWSEDLETRKNARNN